MAVVFDKGLFWGVRGMLFSTRGCSGELEVMDDCCFRQRVVLGS